MPPHQIRPQPVGCGGGCAQLYRLLRHLNLCAHKNVARLQQAREIGAAFVGRMPITIAG